MKENKEVLNKFSMSKYFIAYIYISSILAYFVLSYIESSRRIHIPLIFRIYYMSLSIVLIMLLNQGRKFNKKYISKVMISFFSLMIFICILGFISDVNKAGAINELITYIHSSRKNILLLESFGVYTLSEYYVNKMEFKKVSYIIIIFVIFSAILIYFYSSFFDFIKRVDIIIEILLFIKILMNLKAAINSNKEVSRIIKIYISSTLTILMMKVYGFCSNSSYLPNMSIEVIHLINFRILWNLVTIRFIREPYRILSNSLSDKNKELDKLNYEISVSNKKLEKSIVLTKSKEYLYSTFFRFMPHPIIILNTDNDRILFVNKQFLKFAGIDKERDIVNKHIKNCIKFLDKNVENREYDAIFYIGDRKKYIETKYLSNYEDSTKKLILIKDRTAKVQTEEIRQEVESKRIEESIRKEFLSSISHDLKTPINVIYSAMQVEKIYITKNDLKALVKYNDICKQNCISLIKLTNNLIDDTRINSHYLIPRIENRNIVEVVEDEVTSLVDYVKLNKIDLIFDTNTEECYLNIDHDFMSRIILNLVSNAVKFTPHCGKICVEVHDNNEKVTILVRDNGSGIDQEFINKAFNRYSVGERHKVGWKSGTGIGLSVVKELVELQGGTIEIKRNEDVGTTVSMEFKKGE